MTREVGEMPKKGAKKSVAKIEDPADQRSGTERLNALMSEALGVPDIQALVAAEQTALTGPVSTPGEVAPAAEDADEMSSLDTCGDYGGMADDTGEPCQTLSSFGIPGAQWGITQGRCFHHCQQKLDKIALRKAAFLERYMDQPVGIKKACEDVGIAVSHPYLWKMTDRAFAKTFEALVIIIDAARNQLAEDAMFERICNVDAGADTLRMFFHQNRSHGRWRDVRKDPPAGGNTTIIAGGDVTVNKVWQMGDDYISF